LVYFKVLAAQPGRLELVSAKGGRVPASIRSIGSDRVFAPEKPLPAGQELVLHYQQHCSGKLTDQKQVFRTGPPAQPKLRAAALQITEQGTRYPGDARNESRFYRVRYYSPEETAVANHLLETTFRIDGRQLELEKPFPEMPIVLIEAWCNAEWATGWHVDSCGRLHHVPVGEHTLTVDSHLVGYDETVAPVSTRLTFDCAVSPPQPASTPGAPPEAPTPSARPAPSASPTPPRPTRSFSCAIERHTPEQQAGSALLVFVLLLAARRWSTHAAGMRSSSRRVRRATRSSAHRSFRPRNA
jgi:hypothetical protein